MTPDMITNLLSEAFARPVRITASERIEPWAVMRCELDGAPVRSVIAKWVRDHPTGFRTDPEQLRTEHAALEFLRELDLGLAPRLIAACDDVLVMEDLAPREPLYAALCVDPAAASDDLRAFARAVGELNASTAGRADEFHRRRLALGPFDPRRERERFMGWTWTETRGYADLLGVTPGGEAERELEAVVSELREPGPFLALSNGDSGANNFLVDRGDGRIIDFEFAGYRHALSDAVCFYVPGSFWITVSDAASVGIEDEYRRALAQTVPEAADDALFGFGIATMCLAFAIERLHRFPKMDVRPPGELSRLQMVSTLESAADAAASHHALPHLAGWARGVAAALRRRWPDTDVDLGAYRAYTPRH